MPLMQEDPRRKQFFSMYVAAENSLQRFLQLLVHDHRIFDDVSQAVALRLWELFDTYDPARPFDVWARGVAAKVVNELRRSERRFARLLSPESVAAIVDGYDRNATHAIELAEQLEALKQCLDALPEHARELIVKRYYQSLPVEEVARQTSRSMHSTYKALERGLQQLAECVRRRLAMLVS